MTELIQDANAADPSELFSQIELTDFGDSEKILRIGSVLEEHGSLN